ncbi:DUF4124 domain-containing protein [Sphaerotilus mobilis]|uniref:Uncharacterized protein DUF4124 n=1 Tax=Sphaerotilus mobilis TaxID=47994 RepID=A0A4Q7LUE5_9BURK|nr:DUF4124 domain-containing protein [Sphaerotilus mobilis]RZS57817.1 uncharacterized protein DUF4124 [Sphaerotilus mobilis]
MACTHRPEALRLLLCTLLFGTFASLATPAMAQWKWRDADGRIQYSDRPPPPGIPSRNVLAKPAAPAPMVARPAAVAASAAAPAAASGPATVDPELLARKKVAEAAERKAEDEKLARERQANCTRARDYLRVLETGVPLARVNEKGERESVPSADRDAELRRAREIVTSDCR